MSYGQNKTGDNYTATSAGEKLVFSVPDENGNFTVSLVPSNVTQFNGTDSSRPGPHFDIILQDRFSEDIQDSVPLNFFPLRLTIDVSLPPDAISSDGWCEVKKSGRVLGGFACDDTGRYSARSAGTGHYEIASKQRACYPNGDCSDYVYTGKRYTVTPREDK